MEKARKRSAPWVFIFIFAAFFLSCFLSVQEASAQTYDFDAGMKILTSGLISKKENILKNKRIAVFGIVEGRSSERWVITTYIEDEIVDALVNEGFDVVERRRIEDVIQKEIKKGTDLYFDETQVAEFGKLLGAEAVVTGSYNRWGTNILRITVRCISVADGRVLAANKVNVHTDRIEDLLKGPEKAEPKKQVPEKEEAKKQVPEKEVPKQEVKKQEAPKQKEPKADTSIPEAVRRLAGTWRFGRSQLTYIPVDQFICNIVLTTDYIAGVGYRLIGIHENESFWEVHGERIIFKSINGAISTTFSPKGINRYEGPFEMLPLLGVRHYLRR